MRNVLCRNKYMLYSRIPTRNRRYSDPEDFVESISYYTSVPRKSLFPIVRHFILSLHLIYINFFRNCLHSLIYYVSWNVTFTSFLSRHATNTSPSYAGENIFINLATLCQDKCQRQQSFVSVNQEATTRVEGIVTNFSESINRAIVFPLATGCWTEHWPSRWCTQ
jgi:hypothetical protein